MDKKEYITNQLKRAIHKKYENYCITRIIHKLDRLDIQFITQQLFKRDNGIALADLYFPQINTYVEIDESHHLIQQEDDKTRAYEIAKYDAEIKRKLENLEEVIIEPIEELRISANYMDSIEDINRRTDEVVEIIRNKINLLGNNFIPWNTVNNPPEYFINKKNIKVADNAKFRTIQEVSELFNKGYHGTQKAFFIVDQIHNIYAWCPKLKLSDDDYADSPYENEISNDGLYIFESSKKDNETFLNERIDSNEIRYIFAKYQDETGERSYKFKGVYSLNKIKSNEMGKRAWEKIGSEIDLSIFF